MSLVLKQSLINIKYKYENILKMTSTDISLIYSCWVTYISTTTKKSFLKVSEPMSKGKWTQQYNNLSNLMTSSFFQHPTTFLTYFNCTLLVCGYASCSTFFFSISLTFLSANKSSTFFVFLTYFNFLLYAACFIKLNTYTKDWITCNTSTQQHK